MQTTHKVIKVKLGFLELAKRLGVGVHIHAAEDPVDERLTRESFSCGLFERFDRHGLLDVPGTILAHGTHFSDRDIGIVNERRQTVTMAHNPRSNMNNGVGYTPVARFAKPPMLGTDGIGADMWDEARTALFKSNDAHKALPFERSLQMFGRVGTLCIAMSWRSARRVGSRRSGGPRADGISPGDAADAQEPGGAFALRDGGGVCARRDDRRAVVFAQWTGAHLRCHGRRATIRGSHTRFTPTHVTDSL